MLPMPVHAPGTAVRVDADVVEPAIDGAAMFVGARGGGVATGTAIAFEGFWSTPMLGSVS